MSSIEERLNADSDSWRRAGASPPPSLDELLSAALAPPVRHKRNPRNWWIAAGCAAVILVAAAVPFVIHSASRNSVRPAVPISAGPVAALTCPTSYPTSSSALYVPHLPIGVDGAARMVPQTTPSAVTMCRYPNGFGSTGTDRVPLAGSIRLAGNLAQVGEDLTWLPKTVVGQQRACTLVRGLDTRYLIGLSYENGTVWVSADDNVNSCVGSTNGVFVSSVSLGNVAANSFQADSWQGFTAPSPSPGSDQCDYAGTGRLGQETKMVPDHPTSVLICRTTAPPQHEPVVAPKTLTSGYGRLITALNQPKTAPGTGECRGGIDGTTYQIVFRYSEGPPVTVQVYPNNGCPVNNGSLLTASDGGTAGLVALIAALLK